MMSLGQRPNLNGKNERKPGGLESVFKAFSSPNSKANAVDEANQTLLFLQTTNTGKSPPSKQTDVTASTEYLDPPAKTPDHISKTSPLKLPQPFRRNPSMTSRAKKLHRRSMPAFKFNAEEMAEETPASKPTRRSGFISYIDSDKILGVSPNTPAPRPSSVIINGTPPNMNASSIPPKPAAPPAIPARTRRVSSVARSPPTPQPSPAPPVDNLKEIDNEFIASVGVRRIASFPASQAPISKERYSLSSVSFKPTPSKSPISTSPLPLDGVSEASSGSSSPTSVPGSSQISYPSRSNFPFSSRHYSLPNADPVSPPFSPQSDPFTSPRNSFTENNHHPLNTSQSGPTSPVTGPPAYPPRSSTSTYQRGKGLSRHRSAVVRRKRPSQTGAPSRPRREPLTDLGGADSQQDSSSSMVVTKNDSTITGNMTEEINAAIRRRSGAADIDAGQSKVDSSSSNMIMSFEDEEYDTPTPGVASSVTHGPFSSFDVLRQRPAYLAVFFNYVIDSREPGNFLLVVAVEGYKQLNNTKEYIKAGDSICQAYLSADSVCPVSVDVGMAKSIDTVIHSKNIGEETLKTIFDPAVQVALKEVRQQLADYCATREKGMSNMYGEDKLQQALNLEQSSDAKIVDDILTPTFNKLQRITPADELEQARINLKLDALQNFMGQYGTRKGKKNLKLYKLRSKPSRISGSMDSIIDDTKDKRLSGIGGIFGGKKTEKSRVKSEKPKSHHERVVRGSKRSKPSRRHTIRDVPPVFVAERLLPNKLAVSLSADPSALASSSGAGDAWGLGRLNERAESNARSIVQERPKSAQFAEVGDSAQFYQSGVGDQDPYYSQSRVNDQGNVEGDNLAVGQNADALNRSGSFGAHRSDLKRTVYPTKSRSDPEADQVEQAINQHDTGRSDQSETLSRSHGVSTVESFQTLFPHSKLMDLFSSVNKDPEIDIDDREQQWTDLVPKGVKKHMDKKEIERQQIMNELITTEQHHVRDLKILEKLFYEPLLDFKLLSRDEINQAFPNLTNILQLHRDFNAMLQGKMSKQHVVDSLGDVVLSRFDGEGGNVFKTECAQYCGNQSTALGFIKEKSKKDAAFNQFLENAYKNPVCRRLNLKDFVPMEFQRLTKYPLLLENIIKHTKKKNEDEIKKLRTACERCREILSFVNQTVKEAEDKQKIIEIERNLDREPILKMKINDPEVKRLKVDPYAKRKLAEKPSIHQGTLTWRLTGEKRKLIPLHCILYEDILLLLQKQEERYVLRCQEVQGKSYYPFIQMNGIHVRNVAIDKRAFFVMSYESALMYEFVCSTTAAMKEWVAIISKTCKDVPATPSLSRSSTITVPVVPMDEDDKPDKVVYAGKIVGRAEENEPPCPEEESPQNLASFYPLAETYSTPPECLRDQLLAKNKEIIDFLTSKYELLATMSNLPVDDLEAMLEMCMADLNPDPATIIQHAAVCTHKLISLIDSAASSENTYTKSKSETNSKRFSMADQPSPFHPDLAPPAEQWATQIPHSGEKPFSSVETSSLNSISDLPFSESDHATSPGLTAPSPQFSPTDNPSNNVSQSLGDAVKQIPSPDLPNDEQQPRSQLAPSVPPRSRPSSGFDLCVTSGDASFKKMVEAALMLQQQLTRLVPVNEEKEREKALLVAENQRLRAELAVGSVEITQAPYDDEPPPYFEE